MTEPSNEKPKKARNYFIQRNFFFDVHDDAGILVSNETEEEWKERIKREWTPENLKADSIAMIFHDKDIKGGSPVGLHVHAVVNFKDSQPISNALRLTGCTGEKNCLVIKSKSGAYRYLIHVTNKAINEMKHIYSPDEVICLTASGKSFDFTKAMTTASDKRDEKQDLKLLDSLLTSVAKGIITVSEAKTEYMSEIGSASQWYKVKRSFMEAENEYLEAMWKWYTENPRCLTTIYVHGKGGHNKDTLINAFARRVADSRGIHDVPAAGARTTFDFAGNYKGQRVTTLSEASVKMPMEQFLNVFDPKQAHGVNSRNKDKPWYARYCLLSSSNNLEQFICDMWMSAVKHAEKQGIIRLKREPEYDAPRSVWVYAYQKAAGPQWVNRIAQIRRRFAIDVEIISRNEGKSVVKVYILNGHANNNTPDGEDIYLGCQTDRYSGGCGKNGGVFILFGQMPWEPESPENLNLVIDMILDAEKEYYKRNNYSVNPDTILEPEI